MKKIILPLIVILLIAGCHTASHVNQSMASAEDLGNATDKIIQTLQNKPSKSVVQFYPGQWVQKRALVNPGSHPSPLLLCDFTYAISPQHAVTLFEVGQAITSACQIPVRITPDAVAFLSNHRSNHLKSKADVITDLHWDGPVNGFLDTVTTRLGLSWKYEENIIAIYFLDTQRFLIKTLNAQGATKSVITSGISAQAGSKGIAGKTGSNQSSSVEINSDLYGEIKKVVASMLTPGIGRMELSHTTGVLSVTDTPEALKKVAEYIHEENQSLSKQVLLNVKIMSVEISENNELGIDWGLVYRSLSQKYHVTLKNSFLASPEATAGAISILGNTTQWAGSQVLIKALSEQGKTALLTTKSIVTTNMTPAPIQYAYQEGFLESQTVTQSKEAGTSTSLKPGYLTTGDNITLLPKFIPGTDDLMLDLIMSISSSKGFRTVKSSGDQGNIIELPRTEGQALYQRVWLKSGETLVLSGFEQDQKGGSQSGLGKSSHFLLGGGLSGKNRKTTLVITITPILI